MSTLEQKLNLPLASLKDHMCIYLPDGRQSADDWAGAETAKVKIGEIYTVFHPARVFAEGEDMSELRIAGLAIVFREDAGFPMTYFLEDSNFEMSFLEGVLSSKASEAREQGLAFYCLHSKLVKPLTKEISAGLNIMHKWGGAGERNKAKDGLSDPLFQFFTSFGADMDPALSHDPLPVPDAVLALWNPSALPPKSKAPKLGEFFVVPQVASAPAAPAAPVNLTVGGAGVSLASLLGDDWMGNKPAESTPSAEASGSNNLLEKLASSLPGTPSEKAPASGPSLSDLISPLSTTAAEKPVETASSSLSDLLGTTPPPAKAPSLEELLAAPKPPIPAPSALSDLLSAPTKKETPSLDDLISAPPPAAPATPSLGELISAPSSPSTPSLDDLIAAPPPSSQSTPSLDDLISASKPFDSGAADPFSDSASVSSIPGSAFGNLFGDDATAPSIESSAPSAPSLADKDVALPMPKPTSLADLFKKPEPTADLPIVTAATSTPAAEAPPAASPVPSLSDLLTGMNSETKKDDSASQSPAPASTPSLSDLLSSPSSTSAADLSTSPSDPALASSAGNSLSSLISGVPSTPPAASSPSLSDLIAGKSEGTQAEAAKPSAPSLSDLISSPPPAPAPAPATTTPSSSVAGPSLADLLAPLPTAKEDAAASAQTSLSDLVSTPQSNAGQAPPTPSLSDLTASSNAAPAANATSASDFGLPAPNPVVAPPATPKASKPFVATTFNDHDDAWDMLKSKPKETVPGLETADELMRQAQEAESANKNAPAPVNKTVPLSDTSGLDVLEDLRSALAEEIAASLALNLDDDEDEAQSPSASTGPVPIQAKAADEVADLKSALAEEIAASLSLNLGDEEDDAGSQAEANKLAAMDELASFTSLGKELASAASETQAAEAPKKQVDDGLIDMETLLAESRLPSARSLAKEAEAKEANLADLAQTLEAEAANVDALAASTELIKEDAKVELQAINDTTAANNNPIAESATDAQEPKVEAVLETAQVAEEPKAEAVLETAKVVEEPKVEAVLETAQVVEEPKAEAVLETAKVVEEPKAEAVLETAQAVEEPKAETVLETAQAVEEPKAETVLETAQAVEEPKAETVLETAPVVEEPKAEAVLETAQVVEEPKAEAVLETAQVVEEPKAESVLETAQVVQAPKAEAVLETAPVVEEPKAEAVIETAPVVEEPKAESVLETAQVVEAPKAEAVIETAKVVEEPKAEAAVEAEGAIEHLASEATVEPTLVLQETKAEAVPEPSKINETETAAVIAPADNAAKLEEPSVEAPKKSLIAASSSTNAVLAAVTSDALEDPKGAGQKKLSLQGTLGKLEEQSGKAIVRLQEFKRAHEADCLNDEKLVREQREQFEKAAQDALLAFHDRNMAAMQALVNTGKEALQKFVSSAQSQISEHLPASIAELEKLAAVADISNVSAELESASSAFIELCRERLQSLDEEQTRKMNDISGGADANLKDWRDNQLKAFNDSFEQIRQRVEQHRVASLAALESGVRSLSEELARMKELDLRRLALLDSELRETLEESCNLAEMKLTRHCDMALAEQILPLLADLKSALAVKTREIRLAIADELEHNSQTSLADFEPVLVLGKEAVILIGSNVLELKEGIVENDKKELDYKVEDIGKYFDEQLESLTEYFNEVRKQLSEGSNSQEASYSKKLKQLSDGCKKKISETKKNTEAEIEKQNETALAAWSSKVDDLSVHQTSDFGVEIEAIRNHRRESLRKLQDKLNKLSGKVQTLQAQLIQ